MTERLPQGAPLTESEKELIVLLAHAAAREFVEAEEMNMPTLDNQETHPMTQ